MDGDEMPQKLRKKAIEFARTVTGINRPVIGHRIHIEAFEACFKAMVDLGMVKEEIQNGKDKKSSN